jgi:hypothetical protein
MQIEVVDDCSTKDDPEAVVRELGRGRVAFYSKSKNEGAIANFNTCIERGCGQLLHILHGDDWVLPGFYAKTEAVVARFPELAILGSRCFFAGEDGFLTDMTRRIYELEHPSKVITAFHYGTPLQFAAVVMHRWFYERHGGFLPALVHTADWEMWTRAIATVGGIVSPDVLAVYRVFATNDSGTLMRHAENLRDRERLIPIIARRDPSFDATSARRNLIYLGQEQERHFKNMGDGAAAAANREFWIIRETMILRLKRLLRSTIGCET